jgi:hypothetical protein
MRKRFSYISSDAVVILAWLNVGIHTKDHKQTSIKFIVQEFIEVLGSYNWSIVNRILFIHKFDFTVGLWDKEKV